jgi:hypothetical protein
VRRFRDPTPRPPQERARRAAHGRGRPREQLCDRLGARKVRLGHQPLVLADPKLAQALAHRIRAEQFALQRLNWVPVVAHNLGAFSINFTALMLRCHIQCVFQTKLCDSESCFQIFRPHLTSEVALQQGNISTVTDEQN